MPIFTKNYGLTAFTNGDAYSASSDRNRMSIIDNQLAFISDIVGYGVIDGWNVIDESGSISGNILYSNSEHIIRVLPGSGIINRFYTRTFGELNATIKDGDTAYVYMQKKDNYNASFSCFSDIKSIICSNILPPSIPSGFSCNGSTENSIKLVWNKNSEVDFSYYLLKRSVDNISFVDIASQIDSSYEDIGLSQNTIYYYKLYAVDYSGNISLSTTTLSISTSLDLIKPENPNIISSFAGNNFVQFLWQQPPKGNVDHYQIDVYEMNDQKQPIFLLNTFNTIDLQFIIKNLINGKLYRFIIYSVSINGILSEGDIINLSPQTILGPAEIENLIVSESLSLTSLNNIDLTIGWDPGIDPYLSLAEKFAITIIENGNIVSDIIYVYNDFSSIFSKVISTYKYNGLVRAILPKTYYIIKVQAVDANGNFNKGIVNSITTLNYVSPSAPSNIIATLKENNKLLFTWKNSINLFDHNLLTIKKINKTTLVEIVLVNNENFGQKNSYLTNDIIDMNSTYTVELQSVDEYGNKSDIVSYSFDTLPLDGTLPEVPKNQFAFSGDKKVFLSWDTFELPLAKYYKIWRALYGTSLEISDFSLIETLPSTQSSYVDYSVVNGNRYYYFVTTVDEYGRECLNPVDDGFILYSLILAYPHKDITFEDIENVSLTPSGDPNGNDVLISWTVDTLKYDGYDGFEIYRSIGNKYSWEKIGHTDRDVSNFIDRSILLINNTTYYYMVRKYRDEARLSLSINSDLFPIDSVLLAKIIAIPSGLIITDLRVSLKNIGSVANSYLNEKVNSHNHLNTSLVDKRINLEDNIYITNWSSVDNLTFTTTDVFSGALLYVVRINGELSNIFYEIDYVNKKIIFSSPVIDSNISLECIGLSEIQNLLSSEKLQEIAASLCDTGKLNKKTIPKISHSGRISEDIIPLQLLLMTEDGYNFDIYQNIKSGTSEKIGTATTFYDILNITGNTFAAVTSVGILKSLDGGYSWEVSYSASGPVFKLYYSSSSNKYFAIGGKEVYISSNGLNWSRTSGLDGVSIVRDIVGDNASNVYVSSDLGVYVLSNNSFGDFLIWTKTSLQSEMSSDCYGLWYDNTNNEVVVSTEIGLYYTKDVGLTWTLIYDFPSQSPVWFFSVCGSHVFALTDSSVWRKEISETYFSMISQIDGNLSRKMVIFNDSGNNKIIVVSDIGLFISNSNDDIFISNYVNMEKQTLEINSSTSEIDVTSLNVLGNYIYVGSDKKLFRSSVLHNFSKIYENSFGVTPIIYVDNSPQHIGSYYNTVNNTVCFDWRIDDNSKITIANQYKIFRAKNKGWISQNFESKITIHINGTEVIVDSPLGSAAFTSLSNVSFGDLSETNSNYDRTSLYIQDYNSELTLLTSSVSNQDYSVDIVNNLCYLYYRVYSQVIKNIKYFSEIVINGYNYSIVDFERILDSLIEQELIDYELIPEIPSLLPFLPIDNSLKYLDVSSGILVWDENFDKYDNITIDINSSFIRNSGVFTHKDIDDNIEIKDSGLPYSLAEVNQTNLVKMGMFLEKNWPSEQNQVDICNIPVKSTIQSSYFIPRDKSWYDVLNSTVDYNKEYYCKVSGLTVLYPTSVCYDFVLGKVLVGSVTGLLSIDIKNLNISVINFNGTYENEFVRDIIYYGYVYIVTEYAIYYSTDLSSWDRMDLTGLKGKFNKLTVFNNNYILSTDDGIYYRGAYDFLWKNVSTLNNVSVLYSPDLIYAINDNILYTSNNGLVWKNGGDFGSIQVNNITKYQSNMAIATNSGVRYDNSTFFGSNAQVSLIDVLNDINLSSYLKVNDVVSDGNNLFAFSSNGKYYTINNLGFTELDSYLPSIQRALLVEKDIWMFGYNLLRISSLDYPIILGTGSIF